MNLRQMRRLRKGMIRESVYRASGLGAGLLERPVSRILHAQTVKRKLSPGRVRTTLSLPTTTARRLHIWRAPECGNGIVEDGETCDNGA